MLPDSVTMGAGSQQRAADPYSWPLLLVSGKHLDSWFLTPSRDWCVEGAVKG